MEKHADESCQSGHGKLTTADMLELVQKDLEIYRAILGVVAGDMDGPEKCRETLHNVREGLSRSCHALAMVASYTETMQ